MLYLIIAIVCCVISGYLFKKASGTISLYSPNMMSVIFYLYFVLNNVVGAVIIVNGVDNHYALEKLSSNVYRQYGFWAIMYTIIGFPIGQYIVNIVCHKTNMKKIYNKYVKAPLQDEEKKTSDFIQLKILLLCGISFLAVVYTMITIGGSPLRMIFSGSDAMDMAFARAEAKGNFGGNEYVKNTFGLFLTPFLSYVVYGYWKLYNKRFHKILFWIMFILSVLILTYDLEKAPVLFYFLGFLFFKVYNGYRLSRKALIYMVVIILLFIVIMYIVIMDYETDALFLYNSGFIGRLTLSSNAGLFLTFDIFPSNHPHLGFSSFSNVISWLFDIPYSERSARYVMEYVNPSGIQSGIAGVYNSLFTSEAWANWGIVGVILSPIYVGMVIQSLYIILLSSRKTPFFLALFVFYTIRSSINGGINDYIYNISTLFMIIIYYYIYYFGKGLIEKDNNEKNNCTLSIQD